MQFGSNMQADAPGKLGGSVPPLNDFAPEFFSRTPDKTTTTSPSPSTVVRSRPPGRHGCFQNAHFTARRIQFP